MILKPYLFLWRQDKEDVNESKVVICHYFFQNKCIYSLSLISQKISTDSLLRNEET